MNGAAEWLDPLIDEINGASDAPDTVAAIFERLRNDLGAAEAGRRWWAAFGASDASPT